MTANLDRERRRGYVIVGIAWLICVGGIVALGELAGGVIVAGLVAFGVLAAVGAAYGINDGGRR